MIVIDLSSIDLSNVDRSIIETTIEATAIKTMSIEATAGLSYTFCFLDHTFTISTNRPSTLIYFKKMYENFRSKTSEGDGQLGKYYVVDEPSLFKTPFIWADNKIYPCPKAHMLPGYAHSLIINCVMAKIKSHLLFHAAAVSWQGQGVIILGHSGQGKSTLTIELIRQGFKFFTDEVTCIHRENHLICPFPRTLGVRKDALLLFKEFNLSNLDCLPMICGEEKTVMRLSNVPEIQISDPCLPKYVIILASSAAEGLEDKERLKDKESLMNKGSLMNKKGLMDVKQGYKSFYLAVDRFDEKMITEFKDLPGIKGVSKIEEEAFSVIELTVKAGFLSLPEIKNICYQHQVILFDIARDKKKQKADYSQEPKIYKIPKSRALMALLRSFRGGQESSVLKDTEGDIASLTLAISSILDNAKCCLLTAGRLEEMAGLIKNLVSVNEGE